MILFFKFPDNKSNNAIQFMGLKNRIIMESHIFWVDLIPPFFHYPKYHDPNAREGEYGHEDNTFWDQFFKLYEEP